MPASMRSSAFLCVWWPSIDAAEQRRFIDRLDNRKSMPRFELLLVCGGVNIGSVGVRVMNKKLVRFVVLI